MKPADRPLHIKPPRRSRLNCARHIADLRSMAERRLPRPIFDYLDGGSFDEITLRDNEEDFAKLRLRQRVMTDVSTRMAETTIVGQTATIPVALAPIGLAGLISPYGEIHAARAASKFGVPFCLSSFSTCSIADVAGTVDEPFMFQLYIFKDRGVNAALLEHCKQAKCSALVVTMDANVMGTRHRDAKNGLTVPLRFTPKFIASVARRPAWVHGWLTSQRRTFGNIEEFVGKGADLGTCSAWMEQNYKGSYDRKDLAWLRKEWQGKLIVKGLLDADDAREAVKLGADAIVVSNHGGRQLDRAQSTVKAMPAIRDAVGEKAELLLDGGVRNGLDVLKALGLGARACLIGRAFMYGLAADGETGVLATLKMMADELDIGMALTGVRDVRNLPKGLVI
jgi:L-lactate dehydrogenase (cytochrome)